MKSTVIASVFISLLLFTGCCRAPNCDVQTTFSQISFYGFKPGMLDVIDILEYEKDTTRNLRTDSFRVNDRRPIGDPAVVTLPRSIDTGHNYEVRVQQLNGSYRLTGMTVVQTGCGERIYWCSNSYNPSFIGFGEYFVNGKRTRSGNIQITR